MNIKAPLSALLCGFAMVSVLLFHFSARAQFFYPFDESYDHPSYKYYSRPYHYSYDQWHDRPYYHSYHQPYYHSYYEPYYRSYYHPFYSYHPKYVPHYYPKYRSSYVVRRKYYRHHYVRKFYEHRYLRHPVAVERRRIKARRFAAKDHCGANTVSGTVYNTPHQNEHRSWTDYRSFRLAVHMEGSGILSNGRVLNYDGSVVRNTCPKYFGDPTVVAGGRPGNCLIPFVSIAADLRLYRRGDIIEVPQLKGKWVSLPPSGIKRQHPGYFIVQDSGGAIKGRGRFDFYTGSYSDLDPHNTFATGPLRMEKESCDKTFKVITPHNPEYAAKLAAIDQFIYGTDNPQTTPPSNAVAVIH